MVYFIKIKGMDYIKIGYTASKDANERLRSLEASSPFKLELIGTLEGDRETERFVQGQFKKQHFRGEWYRINYDITNQMEIIKIKIREGDVERESELTMQEVVKEKETDLICRQLELCNGCMVEASKALRVPYNTLRRKMSKYGITIKKRVGLTAFIHSGNPDI